MSRLTRLAVGESKQDINGPNTSLTTQGVVAPTSQSVRAASFRPEVDIAGQRTRVLVEQLRALDVRRLDEFEGHLSASEIRGVDEALSLVLALR